MHGRSDAPIRGPAFLADGGAMGVLLSAHDWDSTPLGAPLAWAESLKTLVAVMFGANQPMFIVWGPERRLLYNDLYAQILGERHPAALGRDYLEVWGAIGAGLAPLVDRAYSGRPVHTADGEHVPHDGGDGAGAARFALSLVPVRDTAGHVAGLYGACTALAGQEPAARRPRETEASLRDNEERQSFLLDLSDTLRPLTVSAEIVEVASRRLGERLGASRVFYAEICGSLMKVEREYARGVGSIVGEHSLAAFGPDLLAAYRDGNVVAVEDVAADLRFSDAARAGLGSREVAAFVDVVLFRGAEWVSLLAVQSAVPRAWTTAEGNLIRDVGERVKAAIERARAEAALRKSEEHLAAIFAGASVGLSEVDAAGRFLRVNTELCRILDRPAEALLRLGIGDVTDPADRSPSAAAMARALETDRSVALDKRYRRPDGSAIWASSSIRRLDDADGRLKSLLIVTADLSRRKEAEQRLAESERRLQHLNETLELQVSERTAERNLFATIVERTDIMMMAADLDYNILAINKANADEFARIYGVRPKVGDNMLDLLADQPEHQAQVRAVWGRGLAGEEITLVEAFGDAGRARPHYEISFRTLRDARGARAGCYQFVVDVTERLRGQAELAQAQEALRQSQKLEAVGQLTGGVAHDFNNLLTIIRSSVDFLRRPDLPEVRKRRYLDAVSETVERAAKLTGQLLAFARRQALKPEVFDVGQRVRAIADMLDTLTGARVQVVTEVPETTCLIRADVSQFETALVNMAVNARDAMDGEGTLILRVTCGAALPAIRGHAGSQKPFAAVSLIDTGTGIPPEQIGRIFEPFFTTKEVGKGTGLGLSQVFGFAKQSGGDVDVRSTLGAGTAFTLYLPEVRSQERPAGDRLQDADRAPLGSGQRVLVVEDNVGVGQFATQILEDLGYQPTWAANAEEALDELGRAGNRFDLIFSDVVMPGMGGVALAQELRRRAPQVPVVLTSGYSHVLAQSDAHDFTLLHKPYSAEQLSRILHQALGLGRTAGASADPS
ncbi:PAS domain-containing protein [Methylobacterium organophilum]|uniref:PAS domain-containing protein n=1 Tax=Methylobacterium organophilum TaxID=410 RepID=UPI0019D26DD9|nr:PAS domain-containing protein [Methylobacterium organophilum]MBN6822649.1 PAS domain-containing protein [Methylobacterium organophilum]